MDNSYSNKQRLQSAFFLLTQKKYADAEAAFRKILERYPNHAEALHGLSRSLMATGQTSAAVAEALRAVESAPEIPSLHFSLGIMLDESGDPARAIQSYLSAVRLNSLFFQAWNNLALTLQNSGRIAEAIESFRSAIATKPDYSSALNNLGTLLFDQGQVQEALGYLTRAVHFAPGVANFRANLGRVLLAAGYFEPASAQLGIALDLEERAVGGRASNHLLYAQFGEALVNACNNLGKNPGYSADSARAVNLLQQLLQFSLFVDDGERAASASAKIVELDSGNWRARFARKRSLPVIPSSFEAISDARRKYGEGLDDLLADVDDSQLPKDRSHILAAALADSFFHLAYHGENDRPLQEKLSTLWSRLLATVIPDCQAPILSNSGPKGRIRIGFIGSHFRLCTVGRYFGSWITGLDPIRFEVNVFMLEQPIEDSLTAEIRGIVHRCVQMTGELDSIARSLRAEDLDVLIYPELGMDNAAYVLAGLRLAPIQCTAWGHPVTSGHKTVDYFLSSEWAEPPGAQTHYTECLIRLPGLGTAYRPETPAVGLGRADFGLPTEGPLLFYPHSPFKVHPQCDELVARVMTATPGSYLIAISRENPWVTRSFRERIHHALSRHGVDHNRLIILGGQSQARFLALAGLCSALLDTLHWSSGNTALDVLTVGLPIVAMPGVFMRGNQSAGILHALGLDELIASNATAYVEIARRLCIDVAWQRQCSAHIKTNHGILFNNQEPIWALEEFLLQVSRRQ